MFIHVVLDIEEVSEVQNTANGLGKDDNIVKGII